MCRRSWFLITHCCIQAAPRWKWSRPPLHCQQNSIYSEVYHRRRPGQDCATPRRFEALDVAQTVIAQFSRPHFALASGSTRFSSLIHLNDASQPGKRQTTSLRLMQRPLPNFLVCLEIVKSFSPILRVCASLRVSHGWIFRVVWKKQSFLRLFSPSSEGYTTRTVLQLSMLVKHEVILLWPGSAPRMSCQRLSLAFLTRPLDGIVMRFFRGTAPTQIACTQLLVSTLMILQQRSATPYSDAGQCSIFPHIIELITGMMLNHKKKFPVRNSNM